MRFIGFIIFFVYVYFEISFFIVVANSIGVFLALVCIIATSILGFSLVKTQGVKNFSIMKQKIANNQNPKDEIIKSVALLFSGFLLLIPGFLTDILGAVLLIPNVQEHIMRFLVRKMPIKSRFVSSQTFDQNNDIIEGEFKYKDDE
ncbi:MULTISPECIES: FxsA family protein [unclassified Gilliamella]|uniref:FxsA family protein n=1 Tax=unclassified Gilliamella TaxID=2685620 RepID=UPI001323D3DE|nr:MULTISPECIES: FxsA family protein [unclassified Gilliamella]MWN31873.1 membrane protein FxsA [Gilliamella sp. Pra-s60]MWP29205.1 membrane protein FxsA [Gilliamella sp. Pra-s54]